MAEPEFSFAPTAKKQKLGQFHFCTKRFTQRDPAVSPALSKIQSLFDACQACGDEIGKNNLAFKDDIHVHDKK